MNPLENDPNGQDWDEYMRWQEAGYPFDGGKDWHPEDEETEQQIADEATAISEELMRDTGLWPQEKPPPFDADDEDQARADWDNERDVEDTDDRG